LRSARFLLCLAVCPAGSLFAQALNVPWSGYAHDAQHTAVSANASQTLGKIHWQAPVDTNPPSGGDLYIHYGSPVVTAANTVLLPVRTATGGFEIQARNGANGNLIYTLASDYTQPAHDWVPPYSPVLSLRNRIYYPGAGGTIYYRDQVDSATGPSGQIAFYGNSKYTANQATLASSVQISTPLISDRYGDIYFGFVAQAGNAANVTSGIARVSYNGTGTWVSAQSAAGGDASIVQVALNCAPALSNDQRTLYFAVTTTPESGTPQVYNPFVTGDLVSVNSTTLTPVGHIQLLDPRGGSATLLADSSASPMVGPDGDVYYGVLETPCCSSHNDRGWMLHFNSALTATRIPGSFGWDDTASVVASTLVPSYKGTSSYLLLTKYNNYVGIGSGTGINQVAILDPNASMQDEYSSASVQVMKEVITITGVTADPHTGYPNAVKEWCINTAVIDPFTKSAIINSEDGVVYRWDFTTNSFTQKLRLTSGRGEAYTPTAIGVDGTVYAINDAILFAVGN
jgi:hypothetical protein